MLRWLFFIPIGYVSLVNTALLLIGWYLEFIVFKHTARYPPLILLVGVFGLSYTPYYLVTRGETIFEHDPGGKRSMALWYCIAYLFTLLGIVCDIPLIEQWLLTK